MLMESNLSSEASTVTTAAETQQRAREIVDKIRVARNQLCEEIPGWIVRHPTTLELADNLTFILAETVAGQLVPFILPNDSACVFVVAGEIECAEFRVIEQGTMQIFRPGGATPYALRPLSHPTRIICTYFNPEVISGAVKR